MAGFGDAIKYLYRQFILRDVLSFVTPGAIVSMTALLLFLDEWRKAFEFFHTFWPLYLLLFGLFYMVGFAIQCFGEIFGIICHTRIGDQSTWGQRFRIFWRNWHEQNWFHKAHIDIETFATATRNPELEWERARHERFTVLKQMCANGFLAIIIAVLLIPISHYGKSPLYLLIVGIPLLASLFWGYRVHILKEDDWREVITSQAPEQ